MAFSEEESQEGNVDFVRRHSIRRPSKYAADRWAPGFYLCECRFTQGFRVPMLHALVEYNGNAVAFRERYGNMLQEAGADVDAVLADVRAQHAEREREPTVCEARALAAAKSYTRVHPILYKPNVEVFVAPELQRIVQELCGCMTLRSPAMSESKLIIKSISESVQQSIAGLKEQGLLTEVREGIWTCKVFTNKFCDLMEEELENFRKADVHKASGVLSSPSTTMLSELGLAPALEPLVYEYLDVLASCLVPNHTLGIDSYRAFTEVYTESDIGAAKHCDNSEVSLNINIGGDWDGGEVAFYGISGSQPEPNDEVAVLLRKGYGVLHAGREIQQARPVTRGRRHNMMIWARSSRIRNEKCPMCGEKPRIRATNKYEDYGFRPSVQSPKELLIMN